MATYTDVTDDSSARAKLTLVVNETTLDKLTNTSTLTYTMTVSDNSASFGGTGHSTWSIKFNGVTTYSGSDFYDFTGNSGTVYTLVNAKTITVNHGTDGTGSVSIVAHWDGKKDTGWLVGAADISTTFSLTTFTPGKKFNGTTQVPMSTYKRFDGTNWVTLTTKKRYDGTSWVNISN